MSPEEKARIVQTYGLSESDAQEWYTKFKRHCYHTEDRGMLTELTFDSFMSKVSVAGLKTPDQIGRNSGQFVLGRVGDVGNYEGSNCRFIPVEQNYRERIENGCCDGVGEKISQTKTGRTKASHAGIAAQADKLAKEFVMIDPNGVEHRGKNVFEFCQANGLNAQAVYGVFAGRRSHHKGWSGKYVIENE